MLTTRKLLDINYSLPQNCFNFDWKKSITLVLMFWLIFSTDSTQVLRNM